MRTTLACIAAIPLFASTQADAADFSGPRIEAHTGWERVSFGSNGTVKGKRDNGFFYGASAGYDVPIGKKVIAGIEAGFDLSTVSATTKIGAVETKQKLKWDAEASARLGVTAAPGVLLYLKAGYARLREDDRVSTAGSSGTTVVRDHRMRDGIRVGGGGEFAVTEKVYAKAEYRYSRYEDHLERHQLLMGVGVRF